MNTNTPQTLNNDQQYKQFQNSLFDATKNGDVDQVKHLLSNFTPKPVEARTLETAVLNNDEETVRLLTPLSNVNETMALLSAAQKGYIDIVQYLIPLSDQKQATHGLMQASQQGHIEIVKLLLPLSDPLAFQSMALHVAIEGEHIEIIKLLAPVSNCNGVYSHFLRGAVKNKQYEIIEILIPECDCDFALSLLEGEEKVYLQECIDHLQTEPVRQRLTQAIEKEQMEGFCLPKRKI